MIVIMQETKPVIKVLPMFVQKYGAQFLTIFNDGDQMVDCIEIVGDICVAVNPIAFLEPKKVAEVEIKPENDSYKPNIGISQDETKIYLCSNHWKNEFAQDETIKWVHNAETIYYYSYTCEDMKNKRIVNKQEFASIEQCIDAAQKELERIVDEGIISLFFEPGDVLGMRILSFDGDNHFCGMLTYNPESEKFDFIPDKHNASPLL